MGLLVSKKEFVQQIIPPFIIKYIRKRAQSNIVYKNFEESAQASSRDAYHGEDLVRILVEKNFNFIKNLESKLIFDLNTLRTLIPFACIKPESGNLNVIDFGGGAGYHYTIVKKTIDKSIKINWCVVETAELSNESQLLANDELNFFSDIDAAKVKLGKIDLVFTSSALQYCPSPLDILKKLIDLNSKYIFITRTPFIDSPNELITTQTSRLSDNGPGPLPSGYKDRTVTYPITYVSRSKIELMLSEKYEIRFTFEEGSGVFGFRNEPISMQGYFCVRKPNIANEN